MWWNGGCKWARQPGSIGMEQVKRLWGRYEEGARIAYITAIGVDRHSHRIGEATRKKVLALAQVSSSMQIPGAIPLDAAPIRCSATGLARSLHTNHEELVSGRDD